MSDEPNSRGAQMNSTHDLAVSDLVWGHIISWMVAEREYQHSKFSVTENDRDTPVEGCVSDGSYWEQQFNTYLSRLGVFPLDTLQGRQAAAKFVATALGFLESVIRVHGPLPQPGVPSGELRNWDALQPKGEIEE